MPINPNNTPNQIGTSILSNQVVPPNASQQRSITIPKPQGLNKQVIFNLLGIVANTILDSAIIHINSKLNSGLSISNDQPNEQNQFEDKNLNVNSDPSKQFLPDAIPNGKGGYTPSFINFWDGRISSVTGLPVMTAITFIGTTYTALNGQQITIPTITFEMVIITMKQGKIIEKTEIAGNKNGSVKEWIGRKDWDINIKAIISASQNVSSDMTSFYQTGKYPTENMEIIDFLLNAEVAIKIQCPYIQNRVNGGGDTWLVIDDGAEINQIEGEYEIQRINIPCCTDFPLLIQIAS